MKKNTNIAVGLSKEKAQKIAPYVKGLGLVPYESKQHGDWRFLPEESYCSICKKRLCKTKEDAKRNAEYLTNKKGISLRVYECPHRKGFHLTSSIQRKYR